MDVRIDPRPLIGAVEAISSKSDAHRLLIAAALADRPVHIEINTLSKDILATQQCLKALGDPNPVPDCGESGTTLRFLLPVAAALGVPATFIGQGRLPERPLGPLVQALQDHGCTLSDDRLPLTIGGKLQSGNYELAGNISSQFISGLLFALPLCAGDSEIALTTPLESAAYVGMTLRTLARFGVRIDEIANGWSIPGGQVYTSTEDVIRAEGDWSNAAFFLAAGALGGSIQYTGLDPDSLQGDRAIADILRDYGAQRKPFSADVSQIPDMAPVLSVLGACAVGETRIYNAARLRLKESDRLLAICNMLTALGVDVTEGEDSLVIRGTGQIQGGTAQSAGDHRIAMAAAVAACAADGPVTILGAEAVEKSYPSFWEEYKRLGGIIHVI